MHPESANDNFELFFESLAGTQGRRQCQASPAIVAGALKGGMNRSEWKEGGADEPQKHAGSGEAGQ